MDQSIEQQLHAKITDTCLLTHLLDRQLTFRSSTSSSLAQLSSGLFSADFCYRRARTHSDGLMPGPHAQRLYPLYLLRRANWCLGETTIFGIDVKQKKHKNKDKPRQLNKKLRLLL